MMAALITFAERHPVLAVTLAVILLCVLALCMAMELGLRQLPPASLSETDIAAPITSRDDLDAGRRPSAAQPLPWTRGGGNWWPIP